MHIALLTFVTYL